MIWECLPVRVERIWGSLPSCRDNGDPVGEIWLFCSETILRSDTGEEKKLSSFFPRGKVPLILKTLHSRRDLSVQVHPGKNRIYPVKDESWAVLEGGCRILHGIRDGISAEEFAGAVKQGSVEELLLSFPAEPGDLFHLPAGTIHALGGGLTVLEVQLNCNITYRLWDYGRRDSRGNQRELHTEKGLAAIDWSSQGKAEKIVKLPLSTEDYSLRNTGAGTVHLAPMEITYAHSTGKCYFSADGGELKTSGETWIVRIENER